jgi:uncharacterized protein
MANSGFKLMDSDLHLIEPADLWPRYIDPAFKDAAPIGNSGGPRLDAVELPGGKPLMDPVTAKWFPSLSAHMEPLNALYEFALKRNWDSVSQLEAMEQEGIDVAILFPTRGLYVLGLDSAETAGARGFEPALATAIARAYNDWLYDFCAADRQRLVGAAMVAPHDVEAAVAETRRCVNELGFKAVYVNPAYINKRPWHDPYYDPLWAECERLDVAVGFHGGGPGQVEDFGIGLAHSGLMMWHTFSHSLGPMAALVNFTAGGVFDRYPRLRAAFLEANCSWAPWLLGRLDDHYEEYTGKFEFKLAHKPSTYFKRNCYVSMEADEAAASLYLQWFGDDNVVFSTDYPHPDSKFPHSVTRFLNLPLTERSKRKILWDNCARLYNL